MILVIDCGNTRAKWGLHRGFARPGDGWRTLGSLPIGELGRLESEWQSFPQPRAIAIAHVAGSATRERLAMALRRFEARPIWVSARASQCGVTNGYTDPAQLGADRWAALIGARQIHRGPVLVVNAGTATTVDVLSSSGLFRGGLILPGPELMKESLATGTAGLPLARGEFAELPRNTADAIETGCLLAQVGAIERMHGRLEPGALCLVSGGSALRIAGRLNIPARVVENLVLEGLVLIASS